MSELTPSSTTFVNDYKTKVLNLKWRDNDNVNDCGVFCLKHMETYHGQAAAEWDIGLKPKDVWQLFYLFLLSVHNNIGITVYTNNQMLSLYQDEKLKKMRVEFCGRILTDKANTLQNEVLNKSKFWAHEKQIDLV